MKADIGVAIYNFEEIKALGNKRMLIFGAGQNGKKVYAVLNEHIKIVGFVDNSEAKQGTRLCGLPIYSPDELFDRINCSPLFKDNVIAYDIIFISVENKKHKKAIINQLTSYGVDDKCLFYWGDCKFHYPKDFYILKDNEEDNESVNKTILIIMKLLKLLGKIDSVIDLGCGNGLWLSILNRKYGVNEILGVDGSYASDFQKIAPKHFMAYDLSKPLNLNRKFDLAMSIEVAEHLPANSARVFVDSLCKHSDMVLFSAAIPGQQGVNHINCQYPSWWAKLFAENGFICIDALRPKFCCSDDIFFFYKTNMMFYLKNDSQRVIDFINYNITELWSPPLDIVHISNQ